MPEPANPGGAQRYCEDWSERAVVVTGAAGGIGAGIAAALVEAGAKVMLTDLEAAALERSALRLGAGQLATFPADIRDPRQVGALAEHTLSRYGSLYGWVNNAGTLHMAPAEETTHEDFVRQFDVNVAALFDCCKAAARAIGRSGEGGAIVNVASNAGKVGFPSMVGYNASKAAVINLTRNLAEEWAAHGVNVNAVCPGSVGTPMLRQVADYHAKRAGQDTDALLATFVPRQLGRSIEPVEVGRVVVFLLSAAARVIRGQSVNVDAGDTPY